MGQYGTLIAVLRYFIAVVFYIPLSLSLSLSLQDVQVVSTDENQVLLALQEWYQTDTYNLYESDPQGVYYSIVLENVRSTKQPEENVLIDVLEVSNSDLKGIYTQTHTFSKLLILLGHRGSWSLSQRRADTQTYTLTP